MEDHIKADMILQQAMALLKNTLHSLNTNHTDLAQELDDRDREIGLMQTEQYKQVSYT